MPSRNPQEVMSMAGRIVGSIVLLLILLVGLTWAFGSRTKARLAANYPAPGRMVDVGGYRMHVNCQGASVAGSPTVVMEAAHSEPGLSWAGIQPEVAKFARVCTYDRAGLGWSERSPKPRTAPSIVDELHTLLARAGIEPPYVLVGHSIGGLYVRLYAHEYPEQVAGMVLVDSTHEEQYARMPEGIVKMQKLSNKVAPMIFGLLQALNSIGLMALLAERKSIWPLPIPPEGQAAYMSIVFSGTRHLETAARETTSIQESFTVVRAQQIGSLGDIPLTIISAGRPAISAGHGISAADAEQMKRLQDEMHAELAALSTRGKRVIAKESGHYVQVDQPQVVIDAIREVVESARR
jgi:pimeloyl-ACP methyl ester carboxylesterase